MIHERGINIDLKSLCGITSVSPVILWLGILIAKFFNCRGIRQGSGETGASRWGGNPRAGCQNGGSEQGENRGYDTERVAETGRYLATESSWYTGLPDETAERQLDAETTDNRGKIAVGRREPARTIRLDNIRQVSHTIHIQSRREVLFGQDTRVETLEQVPELSALRYLQLHVYQELLHNRGREQALQWDKHEALREPVRQRTIHRQRSRCESRRCKGVLHVSRRLLHETHGRTERSVVVVVVLVVVVVGSQSRKVRFHTHQQGICRSLHGQG